MTATPIPQSVLESSGIVGTWWHDHWSGRLAVSAPLAGLLGLDPEAAVSGVTVETFLDRAHVDDRVRIENYLHAVAETGGSVEAEFRICDADGGERWVLMRGRVERDAAGHAVRGLGIAIDRTEEQAADRLQSGRMVNRMAEHVIALRDLAEALHRPALTARVETLMIEVGRELARQLRTSDAASRH